MYRTCVRYALYASTRRSVILCNCILQGIIIGQRGDLLYETLAVRFRWAHNNTFQWRKKEKKDQTQTQSGYKIKIEHISRKIWSKILFLLFVFFSSLLISFLLSLLFTSLHRISLFFSSSLLFSSFLLFTLLLFSALHFRLQFIGGERTYQHRDPV